MSFASTGVSRSIRSLTCRFAWAALLGSAFAGTASAQAVLVDFEQLSSAPCNFNQTGPLHDELASLGVHFSGPTAIDGGAVLD